MYLVDVKLGSSIIAYQMRDHWLYKKLEQGIWDIVNMLLSTHKRKRESVVYSVEKQRCSKIVLQT